MNTPRDHHSELAPLVAAALEQTISDDDWAKLMALLKRDPDARRAYLRLMAVHGQMVSRYSHRESKAIPITAPAEPIIIDEPAPAPGGNPAPGPRSLSIRTVSYALAAALLAACGIAIYLLAFSAPTDPEPDPSQPGPAVATLIENTGDLRTPHGYPAEGDDYSAGEYSLDRGTAEFMLTNAVNVQLRGRTRMLMRNNMNVALSHGSAEFVVPSGAEGFTVHLPDGARVIDLGTRFVVKIGTDGKARLGVVEGSVRLVRDRNDTQTAMDRILSTGSAVVIADAGQTPAYLTPGGTVVDTVTIDPVVFNAATNKTDRGDEPPGLAEAFAHSAFIGPRVPPEAAFGRGGTSVEPGKVLFANRGKADNGNAVVGDGGEAVDHLEWTTREPVTLGGYRVELRGDGPAVNAPRSAQMVRLTINGRVVDTFDADGRSGVFVRLFDDGPVTGKRFRLELTRTTDAGDAAGPRILEIDAVNVTAPAALAPDQRINIPPTQLDDVGIVAHPVSGDSR